MRYLTLWIAAMVLSSCASVGAMTPWYNTDGLYQYRPKPADAQEAKEQMYSVQQAAPADNYQRPVDPDEQEMNAVRSGYGPKRQSQFPQRLNAYEQKLRRR